MAGALARAHAAGILPSEDGVPKILDFGLAKLTEPQVPSPPAPCAGTSCCATIEGK
jgi:hypothetical protein